MINNINNSNNYNSITVQQEITTNGEEEKEIKNINNELYNNIFDNLLKICKKCHERVCLKHKKPSKLIKLYNKILPIKKEYDTNVLNIETLKKEFQLLKKIQTILTEMNNTTFIENLEIYELNRELEFLDDKYDEHTKNEFIKFKELCDKLSNLFEFYKENKINYFSNSRTVYDKLIKVDNYYNIFMNCLQKLAGCRITEDFWGINDIVNDENNENKEIEIYGTHKIKKKDRKKTTYLRLYIDLKMRRNVFRKLLDYVKDSNYLEKIVKKEEKILKKLFSYLENLVRILNIPNCMIEGNGISAVDFDLNHEFYYNYDAESKDSNPVKFKYLVYYVIDNFYRKEIRNIENKIGKRIEKINSEKYGKDGKEEEKLKEIYKNLYDENNAYYDFIFHLVFDAINTEMLNLNIFHRDCELDCKYEMQKFYNLQNMLRTIHKTIRDVTEKSIKKSRVKYYKDIIYCLKNERAMLRKIYDFIMSYVPNLKDKEKFINVDFEKLNEKEKEEIKKEKEEIKNSFKKAFLDEIKNNKDKIVIRDDLWRLNNMRFPSLNNKKIDEIINEITDEESSEESSEHSYVIPRNEYFFGDPKYSSVFLPEISMMRNNNFNSVFNEIENAADEYGNLKENNTINNEPESESNEEILRKLEKCYKYFSKKGVAINICDFRLLEKLVKEYRDLVNNSKNKPKSNNKNYILNKLYKLLNETINFYFDEKNGKFFIYDIFYRV